MSAALSSNPALDIAWLAQVEEETTAFLRRLADPARPGRFGPCENGVTPVGRQMGLGFSCFALRTLRMFGRLTEDERLAGTRYLCAAQEQAGEGAFRDEPELRYIARAQSPLFRIVNRLRRRPVPPGERALLLAETKQALATLHELGVKPERPFRGFPQTPAEVRAWLEKLDWRKPWGAGGQSGALIVFLCTQAPQLLPTAEVSVLLATCRSFFAELADPETGAYFRGARPEHGELINGAMKVLMSLDWLGVTPHYADRLVATCLAQPPSSRGCHLVDAIYVLHQSITGSASPEVKDFCLRVLEQIRAHYHPGRGGFSFYLQRAQDSYYGVPITRGGNEADVQGTCLLVWALAMIWRLVAPEEVCWGVLKP